MQAGHSPAQTHHGKEHQEKMQKTEKSCQSNRDSKDYTKSPGEGKVRASFAYGRSEFNLQYCQK